jgi:hypothetical protein
MSSRSATAYTRVTYAAVRIAPSPLAGEGNSAIQQPEAG